MQKQGALAHTRYVFCSVQRPAICYTTDSDQKLQDKQIHNRYYLELEPAVSTAPSHNEPAIQNSTLPRRIRPNDMQHNRPSNYNTLLTIEGVTWISDFLSAFLELEFSLQNL